MFKEYHFGAFVDFIPATKSSPYVIVDQICQTFKFCAIMA